MEPFGGENVEVRVMGCLNRFAVAWLLKNKFLAKKAGPKWLRYFQAYFHCNKRNPKIRPT